MTDTSDIMLAHVQARINTLEARWRKAELGDNQRLDELNLMLECFRNANNLARLAQKANEPQDRHERLVEMDKRLDANEPTITFEGKKPV